MFMLLAAVLFIMFITFVIVKNDIGCIEIVSKMDCSELEDRRYLEYYGIEGCNFPTASPAVIEEKIKGEYFERCLE